MDDWDNFQLHWMAEDAKIQKWLLETWRRDKANVSITMFC